MYIRTLVLGDKFTYDRYYGIHLNFKPKQRDTVSLTSKSMVGRGVLFTEETLTVAKVYFVTDSRLLPI